MRLLANHEPTNTITTVCWGYVIKFFNFFSTFSKKSIDFETFLVYNIGKGSKEVEK